MSWYVSDKLGEHSKAKHKVLQNYFKNYLEVVVTPQVRHFRCAVIDGFCGGGAYEDGNLGSPFIFLNEAVNFATNRQIELANYRNFGLQKFEFFIILNDKKKKSIQELKENLAYWRANTKFDGSFINIEIVVNQGSFDENLDGFINQVKQKKIERALFNIDPYGWSHTDASALTKIMNSFNSPEIFYTFMIGSWLQRVSVEDKPKFWRQVQQYGFNPKHFKFDEKLRTRSDWLGLVEKQMYEEHKHIAPFVSPFAINQPGSTGYNYWLMHFSKSDRAREVYNAVIHAQDNTQAHYGLSGLGFLSYTAELGQPALYGFGDPDQQQKSFDKLVNDIPRLISRTNDSALLFKNFKAVAYNDTAETSADIKRAMIESPDVIIETTNGGKRRSPRSLADSDVIKLKPQQSFYFPLSPKKST